MRVAGVDEVGRGPLAGPLVAAAVVLPPYLDAPWLSLVRDSKLLAEPRRDQLDRLIRRDALAVAVGSIAVDELDARGLTHANRGAMRLAVERLGVSPEHLLLDALTLPEAPVDQSGLIDGDARCISIACASIVAKVARDAIMRRLDARYPAYGFARHKGYGTAAHLRALDQHGPCPEHRRSFAPVAARLVAR